MLNPTEIKRRRDELQLSQAEAAKRGRLPGGSQAWSNVEGARVSDLRLSTLEAIARGLHCSIADIVTEDFPPKPRRATKRT